MASIADNIRAIQDRIGDPKFWAKGTDARPLVNWSEYAYCLNGACKAVTKGRYGTDYRELSDFLDPLVRDYLGAPHYNIVRFNDDPKTAHADVMLFLDTALDVAEAEGL